MKLILHIAGNELRRMRWWALAWLVVLVVPIVAVVRATSELTLETDLSTTKDLNTTAMIAQVVVAYLIVLVLMQGDPVIGTRQFWLTRPIAGWRMLAAKWTAALAVVGGGVLLVGVPWWLWCGFGVGDLARMSGEYLLLAIAVTLLATLVSVLTDSLARAILWSFALYALLLAALTLVGFGLRPEPTMASVILLRLMTTIVAWLLLAGAVAAGVFLTRRRAWAVWVALPAVATPMIVALLLPAGMLVQNEPRERHPERAAGITVTFQGGWSSPAKTGRTREGSMPMDHLRVSFTANQPVGGLPLRGIGARQTWTWSGAELRRDDLLATMEGPTLPGFNPPKPDARTEAQTQKVGEMARAHEKSANLAAGRSANFSRRPAEDVWLQAYLPVSSSWAARMATEPAVYRAKLWLALLQAEVLNEVPVKVGASGAGGSHRAIVTEVNAGAERAVVGFTQFTPAFWTREFDRERSRSRVFQEAVGATYFLIRSPQKEYRTASTSRQRALMAHGVEVSRMILTVADGRHWREGRWVEPAGWLEEASIAYVGIRPEVIFTREVKVDGFTIRRVGVE